MSQMADRSATIYASLVKGEGDDSFILIWSRRNADRSNRIDATCGPSGGFTGADHNTPCPTCFKPKSVSLSLENAPGQGCEHHEIGRAPEGARPKISTVAG